jgi:hypothetical protein
VCWHVTRLGQAAALGRRLLRRRLTRRRLLLLLMLLSNILLPADVSICGC